MLSRVHDRSQRYSYGLLLSGLPYAVVVLNAYARVVAVNPAAEQALGMVGAQLLHRRLCDRDQDCACALHATLRDGRQARVALREVLPGELRDGNPREATVVPLSLGEGADRHALIAFSADEATQPLRAEDIGAMMVHEFKSPLATLLAACELALEDGIDPRNQRKLLRKMAHQVTQLNDLSYELLESFKLQAGQLQVDAEDVQLRRLCTEVADEVVEEHQRRCPVTIEGVNLPPVRADSAKVKTVLRNLVQNAFKYSPAGAPITITVAADPGEVRVSVRDRGSGIPARHLARIFDKYYRAPSRSSAAPGGTGIGLFTARKLVDLHGGRIWVDSRPGEGSCFSFTLPVTQSTQAQAQTAYDAAVGVPPAVPAADHPVISGLRRAAESRRRPSPHLLIPAVAHAESTRSSL